MKKLSIIIPHYNSPHLLEKLIESIGINEDIEVIVVDDNSNEELDKYEQLKEVNSHISFFRNNTSIKGAGKCRNIGISHSTGDYILFADADDYFIDGYYDIIKEYFYSENDLVYFKCTSINIDTCEISDRHIYFNSLITEYLNEKQYSDIKLKSFFIVPWSKLLKRELIISNDIVFDETMVANDVMFSTKVAYKAINITCCNEEIYCVTKSSGTLTTSISEEKFFIRFNVYLDYYKYLSNNLGKNISKLNINGVNWIFESFKYKLTFSKKIRVLKLLLKNNIKLISFKNPIKIFNRINDSIHKFRKHEKKYLKKDE